MESKNENPSSKTFADLVCDGHAFQAPCDFCGRIHFADPTPESQDVDKDLLALRVSASQEPEKYFRHELEHGIAHGWIQGRRFVYGCPCDGLAKYENFIWEHRKLILDYLERRAGEMFGEAMAIKGAANKGRKTLEGK